MRWVCLTRLRVEPPQLQCPAGVGVEAVRCGDLEPVRPPPEYPEDLHDAAKADRTGPFWSSLGEPDETTGVRPAYLRRDDWHISSTYTPEHRAAVATEEQDFIDAAAIELPEEDDRTEEEIDAAYDPFAELQYMQLEEELVTGTEPSQLKLPNTWQEYQFLQKQMAELVTDESLSPADREVAGTHDAATRFE